MAAKGLVEIDVIKKKSKPLNEDSELLLFCNSAAEILGPSIAFNHFCNFLCTDLFLQKKFNSIEQSTFLQNSFCANICLKQLRFSQEPFCYSFSVSGNNETKKQGYLKTVASRLLQSWINGFE